VRERRARLALAEAERTQRPEGFLEGCCAVRVDDRTVKSTVRMAKNEPRRNATFDDELATVLRAMMRAAEDNEAAGIVTAALGSEIEVVNVEKEAVATAWNHTPTAVPAHDIATDSRGNRLARASLTHVGGSGTDMLGVAPGHL
jgi:hypothetical protein